MSKVEFNEVEYVRLDDEDFTVVETRRQFNGTKDEFNLVGRFVEAMRKTPKIHELYKTPEDTKCEK